MTRWRQRPRLGAQLRVEHGDGQLELLQRCWSRVRPLVVAFEARVDGGAERSRHGRHGGLVPREQRRLPERSQSADVLEAEPTGHAPDLWQPTITEAQRVDRASPLFGAAAADEHEDVV